MTLLLRPILTLGLALCELVDFLWARPPLAVLAVALAAGACCRRR